MHGRCWLPGSSDTLYEQLPRREGILPKQCGSSHRQPVFTIPAVYNPSSILSCETLTESLCLAGPGFPPYLDGEESGLGKLQGPHPPCCADSLVNAPKSQNTHDARALCLLSTWGHAVENH